MNSAVTVLERAQAAWGDDLPDWVMALATAAGLEGYKAIAARIGYSKSLISNVINRTYKAPYEPVEQAVRGALMGAEVNCPVLGEIATDQCLRHQRSRFNPSNPQRVQLWRACRKDCPNALKKEA